MGPDPRYWSYLRSGSASPRQPPWADPFAAPKTSPSAAATRLTRNRKGRDEGGSQLCFVALGPECDTAAAWRLIFGDGSRSVWDTAGGATLVRAAPHDGGLAGPRMEATVCAEAGPSPGRGAATSEPDRLPEGRGRILVDPLAVADEHVVGLDGE